MKILYHHRIASKDGQYVHVEELINAFQKLGHEIRIVGPKSVEKNNFGSSNGLVDFLKRHIPGAVYELMEFAYSFVAYLKLKKALKEFKPDIIYERYNLYMLAGIWLSKKYKLPLLLEVNAPLYSERNKYHNIRIPSLARWSESYTWKNADRVFPVTEVLKKYVLKTGVDEDRITVIHNGINVEKYQTQPDTEKSKSKLGLDNKLVLGFTGFMREWHGLERVVDILANYKDKNCHFLVVGDGPARKSVEDRARELGVEDMVTVTGIIERDQIPDYVSAFDIALQPDVVEYASPLKLFEYLALGRAVVAPDSDNIKEILTDGENALLFDATDKNNLKEKIELLIKDDELRNRVGVRARDDLFEKKYTWENNANIVMGLATDMLNS